MTESAEDLSTGADKTSAFFGRLHPVTRFLSAVAILYLAATITEAYSAICYPHGDWASAPRAELYAAQVRQIAYALSFVGGAASVEFLFRIWDELKRARTSR